MSACSLPVANSMHTPWLGKIGSKDAGQGAHRDVAMMALKCHFEFSEPARLSAPQHKYVRGYPARSATRLGKSPRLIPN